MPQEVPEIWPQLETPMASLPGCLASGARDCLSHQSPGQGARALTAVPLGCLLLGLSFYKMSIN